MWEHQPDGQASESESESASESESENQSGREGESGLVNESGSEYEIQCRHVHGGWCLLGLTITSMLSFLVFRRRHYMKSLHHSHFELQGALSSIISLASFFQRQCFRRNPRSMTIRYRKGDHPCLRVLRRRDCAHSPSPLVL